MAEADFNRFFTASEKEFLKPFVIDDMPRMRLVGCIKSRKDIHVGDRGSHAAVCLKHVKMWKYWCYCLISRLGPAQKRARS